ncbi:LysM domain-containing protein [Dyella soli]|uniref:LysM domain-containing protein n=1 Tax=Dyella soli TaxID=522319 RepID=A0A4R0YTP5_9GAMM|nr:LysM domain-containing protein [Dyella soli]
MPPGAIATNYLQHGHYAEGEQQLRQFLAKYPGDRSAQQLLRQLTAEPKSMLGASSRAYVAQPGDSYSTLAARYLGDSSLFLVLARYNGSTDPSTLKAGDALRLPTLGTRAPLPEAASSKSGGASRNAASSAAAAAATPPAAAPEAAPAAAETPAARAQRLQAESDALLKQGQKIQALARLDQALNIDPHLKPTANQPLREQLLASYHERAVVLYRDQKLDQAIALWDHVLAIDPGYERATIYRARAIELQHRLKQI